MKICGLFFVLCLGGLTLVGCKGKAKPAPPAPTILFAEVKQQDVPIYEELIATLDGSTNTDIRAQVSGYLISQNYTEGSHVDKGQLLFQIDPRPYQATADRAQAELDAAQARQLEAQQTEDRNQQLYKQDATSKKNLDNSVQANEAAKAQVVASQAELEKAKLDLSYTKIIAPIDGTIGKAIPNLGDLINPAQKMTTVSTLDPIQANFNISERFYLQYAEKIAEIVKLPMEERPATMEIILSDGSTYPEKGRFYYVNRQVDTSTGTFLATALFPNANRMLRPGQYARVRAVVDNIPNAITIPQRAINEMQGVIQVAVIKEDNTIEIRAIKVASRNGSLCVVQEGLKPGERVVVEGIQKCPPGAKVDPKPFVETPPAAAPQPPKEDEKKENKPSAETKE